MGEKKTRTGCRMSGRQLSLIFGLRAWQDHRATIARDLSAEARSGLGREANYRAEPLLSAPLRTKLPH
jgi:hypothetical protein